MTITLKNDSEFLRNSFETLSIIYVFNVKFVVKQRIMSNYEYIYILEEV